jgi:hypothetical protein
LATPRDTRPRGLGRGTTLANSSRRIVALHKELYGKGPEAVQRQPAAFQQVMHERLLESAD